MGCKAGWNKSSLCHGLHFFNDAHHFKFIFNIQPITRLNLNGSNTQRNEEINSFQGGLNKFIIGSSTCMLYRTPDTTTALGNFKVSLTSATHGEIIGPVSAKANMCMAIGKGGQTDLSALCSLCINIRILSVQTFVRSYLFYISILN